MALDPTLAYDDGSALANWTLSSPTALAMSGSGNPGPSYVAAPGAGVHSTRSVGVLATYGADVYFPTNGICDLCIGLDAGGNGYFARVDGRPANTSGVGWMQAYAPRNIQGTSGTLAVNTWHTIVVTVNATTLAGTMTVDGATLWTGTLAFGGPATLGPNIGLIAENQAVAFDNIVLGLAPPVPGPGPGGACTRRAWLALGSNTLLLEDPSKGYFCTNLDLGSPDVRAVVNPNPDRTGLSDRTQFMGGRVVQADVSAFTGAGARIDDVMDNFAPFMDPFARPVLHYVLDRPGTAERTMTLRAVAYDAKIAGAAQRDVVMQWEAGDPIAYDATQQTQSAWAGATTASGRTYPLVFPRVYPSGGSSASGATLVSHGDVAAHPLIRIYGPITAPRLTMQVQPSSTSGPFFVFLSSLVLGANQWVDIDTARHTVFLQSDPKQSALASVDWSQSSWPYIPPSPSTVYMAISGSSPVSGVTQAQASWYDGYLS
jgi:hypothetical protein